MLGALIMKKDLFVKHVKLVELDAVLDTRLSIYKMMNLDVDAIFNAGYRNRVYDRIPDMDYDKYMELYKNRDNRMLKMALSTELPHVIATEGLEHKDFRTAMDATEINEVWINVFPYDLSDIQQFEIGKAISRILRGTGYNVKVVNYDRKLLTLPWLKERDINALYLYQYEEWLVEHIERIINNDEHYNLKVIAPWLITCEMTEEISEYIDKMTTCNTHPAKLLRGHFAQWFDLNLTKSRTFSTILAPDIYPDYIDAAEGSSSVPKISS